MSNAPIINTPFHTFENTKQSNDVLKHGIEMVESFTSPIYDKLGRRSSESSEVIQSYLSLFFIFIFIFSGVKKKVIIIIISNVII